MVDKITLRRFSDQYGHITGDDLQAFAGDITKYIRQNNDDWAARYGGEEFLICLVNCDQVEFLRLPKCASLLKTWRYGRSIENHR